MSANPPPTNGEQSRGITSSQQGSAAAIRLATDLSDPDEVAIRSLLHRAWRALAARDPAYAALRRAVRAAIIMPGSFALCLQVIGNPTMAAFAAFGSIAMLLLADFRGPIRDRVRSQAALAVVGAGLVCVGTLCSRSDVAAVAAMAIVAVLIIFSGVVSSVLAGATVPLLLGFVLPVSTPGPVSSIPERLAGWGIAGGLSVLAVGLLWPAPVADPLRRAAVGASRALAACLRPPRHGGGAADVRGAAVEALAGLTRVFLSTPSRPTGLTTSARAGVRLVDDLRWLGESILATSAPGDDDTADAAAVVMARMAAAAVLDEGAVLLDGAGGSIDRLDGARRSLTAATHALQTAVCLRPVIRATGAADRPTALVDSLDPSFRAQETSFLVAQIATAIELVATADARSWLARAIGRPPAGIGGPLASVAERARSHLVPGSVWLRNSLRGGLALGVGVLTARVLSVEHAFWVSFGTLTILRSNALGTGETFLRAIAGTVIGFVIGAALVLAIGTNTDLLWALLPVAVLIAGEAPVAISFIGGQASFTIVLFILFNILAPAGWRIGLVRVEDVALGGASSLVVGLIFWPRGAGAALGRALADAYAEGAHYLSGAVAYAITCCAPGMAPAVGGDGRFGAAVPASARAAAASRRLDDTFRTYLAEAGPKLLPLSDVTTLVNGASSLRLAGDAIIDLWREEDAPGGDRVTAARELLFRARSEEEWYLDLADVLRNGGATPVPALADPAADARLRATVDYDLRSLDGSVTSAAVRVVWTGDHLEAIRRLEKLVAGPVVRATGDPRVEAKPRAPRGPTPRRLRKMLDRTGGSDPRAAPR